jgi:hypothetical protein
VNNKNINDNEIAIPDNELKDQQTIKHKSNRGRKKKVKDINNPDKKVLGISIDIKLNNILNKIKDIDKISINYIIISAIKDYILNKYADIWYSDYDNNDKILLNINKDIVSKYTELFIKDDLSINQHIISDIVNKVLGIDDKNNIDKKDIKIEKDKIINMFKNFIENNISDKKDDIKV